MQNGPDILTPGTRPERSVFDSSGALAEAIAEHGLARISSGGRLDLEYLRSEYPMIDDDEIARDAAISVCIRSLISGGMARAEAVRSMMTETPQYAEEIRLTAFLDEVAESAPAAGAAADPCPRLPCAFGPAISGGRRRYELLKRIGSGSSGWVYAARDNLLTDADNQARVAIKIKRILSPADFESNTLAQEAIRARGVEHRNIVRVLDVGVEKEPSCSYIVSELIDGGTLAGWMDEHPSPRNTGEIVEMLSEIASGLDAIHGARLVHSDLKPANILLRTDGSPAITDFGLSLRSDVTDHPGTPSHLVGTPAYMSPEQFRGDAPPGASADIYALGGIAWQLFIGAPPNGDSLGEVARRHESPESTAERTATLVRAGVDHDLAMIIARCLAPEPAQRHRHASDVERDLIAWRERRPIEWTRPGPARRLRLWTRRRTHLAVGALVASVLTVALLAVVVLNAVNARRVAEHQATENALQVGVINELNSLMANPVFLSRTEATLGVLWAVESMLDQPVIGEAMRQAIAHVDQIDLLNRWIRDREAAGQSEGIYTLLMRMQAALYMLNEPRDMEGTAEHLDETLSRIERVIPAGDPMIGECRVLRAVAVIKPMWLARFEHEPFPPLTPSQVAELRRAEPVLLAAYPPESGFSEPIRAMAGRGLRHLYSRQLLNIPDKYKHYPASKTGKKPTAESK